MTEPPGLDVWAVSIPFGKHKGRCLGDLIVAEGGISYIAWMYLERPAMPPELLAAVDHFVEHPANQTKFYRELGYRPKDRKPTHGVACKSCGGAVRHHGEQRTIFCRHMAPTVGQWVYTCPECKYQWTESKSLVYCKPCENEELFP